MTKMAAMLKYGKTVNNLLLQNSMILKLGMHHRGLKLYRVYINGDPELNLTYFLARSNLATCAFERETLLQSN